MLFTGFSEGYGINNPYCLVLPVRYSLLAVILLFATFTTGTIEQKATSQEVAVVTVDSTNLQFSPSTITISEGDAVRFFWSGELLAHNAVAEEGLFDSGDPSREVDYSFTFEIGTNGTYSYICEPHEAVGMVGTIIVEPDAPSIPPEPDPDPMGEVPTKSGETWIPFFGLELIMVIMLIMVIYNFGRSQGHTETSLEIPDSD